MRGRLWAAAGMAFLALGPLKASADAEVETGERLAALLRAARTIVAGRQDLINDPNLGEKGIDGARLVREASAAYEAAEGEPPITDDLDARARRLLEAQLESIREVVDEHQALIDEEGVGFKGFIPAVFARLVNERFSEKVGDLARVKVTAPPELVRNRKARPDEWERAVIASRFLDPAWTKGEAFHEEAEVAGRPAFRMLIPEYYAPACLSCHGGPAGELDVTGYPKEGGRAGDLGAAISIVLFQ